MKQTGQARDMAQPIEESVGHWRRNADQSGKPGAQGDILKSAGYDRTHEQAVAGGH